MSYSTIDSITVLYLRVFLVPLVHLIELIIGHCLKEFGVKWGTSTSVYFTASNGVRQGGILSPRLFSLYIDDLSTLLADTQVGCYVDTICYSL